MEIISKNIKHAGQNRHTKKNSKKYSDDSIKSTILMPFWQYILALYCGFGLRKGILNRVIRVVAWWHCHYHTERA